MLKNKVHYCQPLNKSKFSFQWECCSVFVEHCRLSLAVGGCRYMPRQTYSNVSVKTAPPSPRTPRARLFTDTEMSLATRSNQFRICMLCLDSGSSRFIESMGLYYLVIHVLLHGTFSACEIICTFITLRYDSNYFNMLS